MVINQDDRFTAALFEAREVERFADALAAGAALVATADGTVERDERRALVADAVSHPDLVGIPTAHLLERFDEYVERLANEPERTGAAIFDAVGYFSADRRHARRLLDIYRDIARDRAGYGACEDLRIVLKLPA